MIKNLKLLRNQRGISQQALAEQVGVSQQSINKYENHNIEPDIQTLIQLAEFFETSVDYLIGHTEIRHVVETVTPCDLNAEEFSLMECYRKASPEQRQVIFLVAKEFSRS